MGDVGPIGLIGSIRPVLRILPFWLRAAYGAGTTCLRRTTTGLGQLWSL